jgi:hypothetical protein
VAEVVFATVDHSDIRGSKPHNRDPSGAVSDYKRGFSPKTYRIELSRILLSVYPEPNNVVISAPIRDTTISFRIDRMMKAKLVALAKAEDRTLSNVIEKILKAEIQKHESKPKTSSH